MFSCKEDSSGRDRGREDVKQDKKASEEGVKKRRDLVERVWRVGITMSGGNFSQIKVIEGESGEDDIEANDHKTRIRLEMKLAELQFLTNFNEKNTIV